MTLSVAAHDRTLVVQYGLLMYGAEITPTLCEMMSIFSFRPLRGAHCGMRHHGTVSSFPLLSAGIASPFRFFVWHPSPQHH